MSRRSVVNPRYQKHGAPGGKTRKSAAAAKPKRASGTPPKQGDDKKHVHSERKEAAQNAWRNPGTAEFAKWRRVWYAVFGVAVALLAGSFATNYFHVDQRVGASLSWVSLLFLAAAFYVDFKKVRPIRTAAYDAAMLGRTLEDEPEDSES
jgi:hypothetical protein